MTVDRAETVRTAVPVEKDAATAARVASVRVAATKGQRPSSLRLS